MSERLAQSLLRRWLHKSSLKLQVPLHYLKLIEAESSGGKPRDLYFFFSNKLPGHVDHQLGVWSPFAPFCEHWTELFSLVWRKRCMTYTTSHTSQTWPAEVGYSTSDWQSFSKGVGSKNNTLEGLRFHRSPTRGGEEWSVGEGIGLTYNDTASTDQSNLFLQGYSALSGPSIGAGLRLAPTRVVLFSVVSVSGSFFHLSQ